MLANLVFALLITASGLASGEDWTPFRAFMGNWTGTRTTSTGKVSVTRNYESVASGQHLLVTDRVGSDRAPWGMVSFDAALGGFVLRRFGADGSVAILILSGVSNDGGTLVFDTPAESGGPSAERITHERHGWNEFVERVELRADGTSFTVVSETQFRRRHWVVPRRLRARRPSPAAGWRMARQISGT